MQLINYPVFEIVVVDNCPMTEATQSLVSAMPGIRYVREERPGLDLARNKGISEAGFEIVAFTDDDTKPDRMWLWGLARGFAQSEVMAVTGLVAPMSLDTSAQLYFEDVYGGMGKGFAPRWVRKAEVGTIGLLWASSYGVGANMAFRRSLFARTGLFDPALDVGTASRGGGDIEFFHRLLCQGHTLLYEPSALVWHEHRASWSGLRSQLRDNGCAFVSYLLTCARNRSLGRGAITRFAMGWVVNWLLRRCVRPGNHKRRLILAEIQGMLEGPLAYWKARRQTGRAVPNV
jgi:glycosyltransferase involved in cell wall biosynthesis